MTRLAPALAFAFALLAAPALAQDDPAADGSHLLREVVLEDLPRPDGDLSKLRVMLPMSATKAWPTVLFVHGWSAGPEFYQGLIDNLASRGFAVALFDQVDRFAEDLEEWQAGVKTALDALEAAEADPSSPLFGELDLSKLAVMGHSYGGATTICVTALDPRVKVGVALTPGADRSQSATFLDLAGRVTKPLLVVGAEFDPVTTPYLWARPGFRNVTATERLYVEIARGEHCNITDYDFRFPVWLPFSRRWAWTVAPDEQRRISRSYATAWIETHLGLRPAGNDWVNGARAADEFRGGVLSRWSR